MSMSGAVSDGTATFNYPTLPHPCKTWYRITGSLSSTGATPLIVLHGGPGHGHGYLEPLAELWASHGIPVIHYDQLGCGKSTRLRDRMGDSAFWTVELFAAELENLIEHLGLRGQGKSFDVLGHSWGGMLAAWWVSGGSRPAGLRRVVISNTPASMPVWIAAGRRMLAAMPESVRAAIEKHEAAGSYDDPEYEAACMEFYKRHVCKVIPCPEFDDAMKNYSEDPTVYQTINGPSEFTVIGTLKDYDVTSRLHLVSPELSVLVINGEDDMADEEAIGPFFWKIPQVKWRTFGGCSHTPHLEKRAEYLQTVGGFLKAS